MKRLYLLMSFSLLSSLLIAQNNRIDFNDGEFFFAEEDYEEALYAFTQVYNNGYQDPATIAPWLKLKMQLKEVTTTP
mgnify:CR=1 FL=1